MKLLMCSPLHYGIEYEINPWMSRRRQSTPEQARIQWQGLHQLLEGQLAVDVRVIEPQQGLPDMVFTANAGFVYQNKFIVSNFRHDVRRGEAPFFAEWFRQQGFEIIHLPEDRFFEGEGDLLKCGEGWFAGYHIRSDVTGHQRVADKRLVLPSRYLFLPVARGAGALLPDGVRLLRAQGVGKQYP